MARFLHEAVAVGPATGIAYQTEGNRNAAALDRYVPVNGSGALGSLQQRGALQAAGEGEGEGEGVPTAAYSSSTPQPA
jgi:secreted PhoX family phosphatase